MLISQLSQDGRQRVGKRIRDEMEEKGVTQECAAAELKVDPRTIRNILAGKSLTPQRVKCLCKFLDFDLSELERVAKSETNGGPTASKLDHGGYPFHSVEKFIGDYDVLRHSLSTPGDLHQSSFTMRWCDDRDALTFAEYQEFFNADQRRRDFSQGGVVHISSDIGLLHLLTSWRGAVRLITLTRLRLPSQMMYGAILTQADQNIGYKPALSPIVFYKRDGGEDAEPVAAVGPVTPKHPHYDAWLEDLRLAEREYVIARRTADALSPGVPPLLRQ